MLSRRRTANSKILLRCDANERIGIGHAIRCLALAEAAQSKDIDVVVAYETMPTEILVAFSEIGASLQHLQCQADAQAHRCRSHFNNSKGSGWICVDLPAIDQRQLGALSRCSAHLVVLDDGAHRCFDGVDLIINPNVEAKAENYSPKITATTALALGLKYLPLRQKFRTKTRPRIAENELCTVLITMGGADPDDLSLALGIAFEGVTKRAKVDLLVGPSFSRPSELINRLRQRAPNVHVLTAFQDMADFLSKKQIVVTLAGTSLWEAAASGACPVPIARDELQRATLAAGAERNLFAATFDVENFFAKAVAEVVEGLIERPALRLGYAQRCSEMVDGNGALRVLDLMQKLALTKSS